jgi:hypothetical protein
VRSRSTYFCAKHPRIAARRGARWANRRLEKLVDILRFSKSVGYRDERYFAAKSNFVPGRDASDTPKSDWRAKQDGQARNHDGRSASATMN